MLSEDIANLPRIRRKGEGQGDLTAHVQIASETLRVLKMEAVKRNVGVKYLADLLMTKALAELGSNGMEAA